MTSEILDATRRPVGEEIMPIVIKLEKIFDHFKIFKKHPLSHGKKVLAFEAIDYLLVKSRELYLGPHMSNYIDNPQERGPKELDLIAVDSKDELLRMLVDLEDYPLVRGGRDIKGKVYRAGEGERYNGSPFEGMVEFRRVLSLPWTGNRIKTYLVEEENFGKYFNALG